MSALTKIREAGFSVALVGESFQIIPASSLTQNQREFLQSHRTEIIRQLRAETSCLSEADRKLSTCKGCFHFQSFYEHGGCISDCNIKVMPKGIKSGRWLANTLHFCGKYQSLEAE